MKKQNSKALALNNKGKLDKTSAKSMTVKQKGRQGKPAKESKAKRATRQIGKVIITAMLICVITGCIVVGALALYVMNFVKPYTINLDSSKLKATSIVYANDGKSELAEVSGTENRIWVDLSNTPKNLTNAIISTEDQRFNEHEGVDVRRTLYSFANMIFHFSPTNQGGSTLTQQLIKNMEGNVKNRSPSIKLREIITALDVEKRYSKDQILQAYVNYIDLGNNCYGVQTAANMYFGKDVKDLDLAQCALLAGIIQAPEGYEPYKHMPLALIRQKYVLSNMLNQKMITKAEYSAALKEKITLTPKTTTMRSWFVDQVITDVTNDLMSKYNYDKATAQNMIFTGGLRINTTEDQKIQSYMDEVYTSNADLFKAWDGTSYQSSMVIVDYAGRVIGMEGAQGKKAGNMVLNRAFASYRPAGSSFKPICTYGPAIDKGLVNWSKMIMDSSVLTLNNELWPRDDDGWTNQNQTVDYAITHSLNAVAVRVEQLFNPDKTTINSFNFLTQKLGFSESLSKEFDSTNTSDASSLGLTLGQFSGKSKGVSAKEMAGAYEIFGNGGLYYKPYTYTSVTDADGNVLLQNKPNAIQAISPETSTIMNKLMQNVVNDPNGTGVGAHIDNVPVAGKTGTTPESTDRWWVGLTPEYVGAVWTGYDQKKTIGRGDNPAVTIWQAVMEKVESGRDASKDFPVSGNVVQETYDAATGKLSPTGSGVGWYNVNDKDVIALKNDTNNTD